MSLALLMKLLPTFLGLLKWASTTLRTRRAISEGERKEQMRQLEGLITEIRAAAGVGEWYGKLSKSDKLELMDKEEWYTH